MKVQKQNLKRSLFISGIILVGLFFTACSAESQDDIADFLAGCNTGDLTDEYPQSAEIDCLINLPNGLTIDDEGQSTVAVQFTPDGEELYTLSSGLQKWDTNNWEEIDVCEHEDLNKCHGAYYEKMYFSRENGVVAVQYSGKTYAGSTNADAPLFESSFPRKEGVSQRTGFIDGWNSFIYYDDSQIRYFDSRTGELMSEQEEPLGIRLMEGGRNYYATALEDGRILVLPTSEEYSGSLLVGHQAYIATMMFSDDNTHLVTIDAAGELFIWEMETGNKLLQINVDVGNIELAPGIVFPVIMDLSADNELLVVRRTGGYLTFISTKTGDILAETKMSRPILDIDISPDRTKLALGYASKQTTTKKKIDPSDRSVTAIKVDVTNTSRGPAVILDISGINR
ncbi:MAG: WD40 repeat domain-containing protein [Chloroflexota bacterium]